ncbi:MAG: tRNA pseudouridine(55) synthase TruB [Candidatus Cloacimonetes bacterium]|nr:tRNA pseudouridine(55) synthase TruB [Candidatus Cloacimonadota bacterium]
MNGMKTLSGFMLLDKPEEWTTFDLIRDLRKKSGIKKIGHTGTLDPFATGLVILTIGKITRLSSLLLGLDKDYLVEIELGLRKDTGDITGNTIETGEIPDLTEQKIREISKLILETTSQIPPNYSAVKVNGKRAYKLAREGKDFTLTEKTIQIHTFEICSVKEGIITYKTKVSKGTYIRALTETFAEMLGTIAYTRSLQRTKIGHLTVEDAISPLNISETNWQDYLKSVPQVLPSYQSIRLDSKQIIHFLHGQTITLQESGMTGEVLVYGLSENDLENCLGIGIIKDCVLHPQKVLV